MRAEGVALVTGASRGIGRALAIELARRGFDVVASMRDPAAGSGLLHIARGESLRLRVTRLDVCDAATIEIPRGLRVLVNNAGVEGPYLPVEHAPMSMWRELFETNVFGLVEVTRRAIPELRRSDEAVICNLSSAATLLPMPLFAAYRASKAAVSALGESLRVELAGFGIRVLEIPPGPVLTDMLEGSAREPEASTHAEYRELAARVGAGVAGASRNPTPVADAARSIADAILAESGPLRRACDPLGESLLAQWREKSDEELAAPLLQVYGSTPEK